jgi:chromosome segregation ATPase
MPADYNKDPDPYLDLDEDASGELGDKVQQVRAELESLKQKQEEIEKEKSRLEELKRRQDELDTGRSDMLDKLTRSLVVVQREVEETQKRLEQLHTIYNAFTQHLRQLEAINARGWSSNELPRELSKAISSVEDARAEYTKAQAKISSEPVASPEMSQSGGFEGDYSMYEERGFFYWLKSGFAFTLPLQVLGVIGLLVWIWSVLSAVK